MYTTHRKMRGKLTPRTAKVWPSLATTAHDRRRRGCLLCRCSFRCGLLCSQLERRLLALRARSAEEAEGVPKDAHAPRTTLFVSQVLGGGPPTTGVGLRWVGGSGLLHVPQSRARQSLEDDMVRDAFDLEDE